MTRDEIRKETDASIDAVVASGNDNEADPIEVALINTAFRAYAHVLDDAQALNYDTAAMEDAIASHVSNIIKVFLQRTIPADQQWAAVEVANRMFKTIAEFTTQDVDTNWTSKKPN